MFSLAKLKEFTNKPEQTQIALGVVALLALIFGFWQIKTSLSLPLDIPGGNIPLESNKQNLDFGQDIAQLQQKDSDSDGLSDYDELYVYGTSPYLADTDSDGVDDKTEIEQGTDPNCAEGTDCGPAIKIPSSLTGDSARPTPTAEEIRAFLRQYGASEEQIASYDDDSLVALYKEVSGELGGTSNGQKNTVKQEFVLTPEQKSLIKNMSNSELRQFLINGGADPEFLKKIDDVTLRATVNQQLGL